MKPRTAEMPPPGATVRQVLVLGCFVAAACAPAGVARNCVVEAASLYHLAESDQPYFLPSHGVLLYLTAPLVVASACVLLMAPGLFLSLAHGAGRGVGRWLLAAFGWNLLIVSGVTACVQAVAGQPVLGNAFVGLVIGSAVCCFLVLVWRLRTGARLAWPIEGTHAKRTLVLMAAAPLLCLIALAPKFYWEVFNPDGAHAFESARLLLVQPLPYWPAEAGAIAAYPGLASTLQAYPPSWFIRLFGEAELSARLPVLLYLVVLFAGMLSLIESGKPGPFAMAGQVLCWIALGGYLTVMAFSATYDPYSSDLALPATQDTLLMACFVGFVVGFIDRRRGWTLAFLLLTWLSQSSGPLLVGLWLVACVLLCRTESRHMLWVTALGIGGCLALSAVLPMLLQTCGLPAPGGEHGWLTLAKRFRYLDFTQWQRFGFMALPAGILPAVFLLGWRWQDNLARRISFVTLVLFVTFYIQACGSLHYFVPTMLLPLIVFWRMFGDFRPSTQRYVLPVTGVCCALALFCSLPRDAGPHTVSRRVGRMVEDRIGGYASLDPSAFRRSDLLTALFVPGWDKSVPDNNYSLNSQVLYYYSHQQDRGRGAVNYVIQSASETAPAGARLISEADGAALYVMDSPTWDRHRALRPAAAGSKVYEIPRHRLFRARFAQQGEPTIDLKALVRHLTGGKKTR